MRGHLGLGTVKPEEIPEKVVLSVAETLRKSSLLKISDDGGFSFTHFISLLDCFILIKKK